MQQTKAMVKGLIIFAAFLLLLPSAGEAQPQAVPVPLPGRAPLAQGAAGAAQGSRGVGLISLCLSVSYMILKKRVVYGRAGV